MRAALAGFHWLRALHVRRGREADGDESAQCSYLCYLLHAPLTLVQAPSADGGAPPIAGSGVAPLPPDGLVKLAQFIAHLTAHLPTAEAHISDARMRAAKVRGRGGPGGSGGRNSNGSTVAGRLLVLAWGQPAAASTRAPLCRRRRQPASGPCSCSSAPRPRRRPRRTWKRRSARCGSARRRRRGRCGSAWRRARQSSRRRGPTPPPAAPRARWGGGSAHPSIQVRSSPDASGL